MYFPYFKIEILTLRELTTSLSFEQLGPGHQKESRTIYLDILTLIIFVLKLEQLHQMCLKNAGCMAISVILIGHSIMWHHGSELFALTCLSEYLV